MTPLNALVNLSRALGDPTKDYVIIGEGNTSARIDESTFYVKASGQQMESIDERGFVAVNFAPILAMLDATPTPDAAIQKTTLHAAKQDPSQAANPSIETTFHAMLLHECGAAFVGHTHPVAVNKILCSTRAQQFAFGRTCPDEVVLCGPQSAFVPYYPPGLPLALAMRDAVRAYIARQNEPPKLILLQNHGIIALGATPKEVQNITAMCVKAAHIFVGACSIGEPVFLSESEINTLYRRPDEVYRRKMFVEG